MQPFYHSRGTGCRDGERYLQHTLHISFGRHKELRKNTRTTRIFKNILQCNAFFKRLSL